MYGKEGPGRPRKCMGPEATVVTLSPRKNTVKGEWANRCMERKLRETNG